MAQPQPPRPQAGGYFEKKGEIHELRQLLRGAAAGRNNQQKRDAIKKVIAYMTLGIDVSPLFTEMIMASATTDLVQKKMVYLYLQNYAESNAELAILAVNTLQNDCRDDDPMIRGLAVRSLCSLSLPNMVEYLEAAVQKTLGDVNGYVRKTAVIGAVKLFHLSRSSVLDGDIAPTLKRLIHDSDPHVVANAIYAVEEVFVDEGGFTPTRETVTNLLNRLNQFSEWGQCAVLRILSKYRLQEEGEMYDIMNILDSLLKQSSSAVVLSVTKIFLDMTTGRTELQGEVLSRLKGPLLTLMAAATPELAYTVLVHIQALCMRGRTNVEVFGSDYKQFFCRYNEPSYIKQVKIDVLQMLADDNSAQPIVAELSEYVTDVDAEISRRAIRAIGQIAVHVPATAEMIVGSLMGLLELDIDYVSTESAVVMKDLARKYPQQFTRATGAVERCLKIVTEPEGKCAILWILGEYGLLIDDAPYLLEPMIEGFLEEQSGTVRLEMLTATVKLFFQRAPEMQKMLGQLLQKAIQETSHPDVRDRALLYYRLLEHGPEEARRVICAPKEIVEDFQEEMDMEQKQRLFEEFNTLSIVYRQPSQKFVHAPAWVNAKMVPPPIDDLMATDGADDGFAQEMPRGDSGGHFGGGGGDLLSVDDEPPAPAAGPLGGASGGAAQNADLLGGMDDLFGDPSPAPAAAPPTRTAPVAAPTPAQASNDLLDINDLLGGMDSGPPVSPSSSAPFALMPGVNLDAGTFQNKWGLLPDAAKQQRQMRPLAFALATGMVEDGCRRAGMNVMASGGGNGQPLKFFFYARQASGPAPVNPSGEVWFLVELSMTPGSFAQATLKADNAQPASAERFMSTFWESLQQFVA